MRRPYTWSLDIMLTAVDSVWTCEPFSNCYSSVYMTTRLNELVPIAQHGVTIIIQLECLPWTGEPGPIVTLACAGTTEDSIALDEAMSTAWSVV